jgi:predicted Zn-dependent peptidase
LWEAFLATAFLVHPYRNPVIGWQSDVSRLRTADIDRFFRAFYAPNNTWLAVVGDVEPERVITVVEKYFANIPAQPLPERRIPEEPLQRGVRRVVVKMPANPQMLMGFHKPNAPHDDDVVFEVIRGIFTRGALPASIGSWWRSKKSRSASLPTPRRASDTPTCL